MNQNDNKPITPRQIIWHNMRPLPTVQENVIIKVMEVYAAQQVRQAAEERDKAVEALSESLIQLKYLDNRFPTGSTPNIVARIETFLNSLNAAKEGGE